MEVAEVMAEVEADRIFYDRSGGGMTLSGGEPMHQFSFTYNLLATAKSRGIHTVLETCGQSPRARYVQIFPLVDQFLFDYKASDPARHRQLTGVDNTTIIANLNYLLSNDADLVLRCPLIPGINDDDDHLSAIAAWSRRTPGPRQVEIMAYHEMGKEKARQLGGQPLLDDIRTPSETIQRTWLEKLHAYGCHNIVIS
jgi:pyruvate formate lyase activating enzyme